MDSITVEEINTRKVSDPCSCILRFVGVFSDPWQAMAVVGVEGSKRSATVCPIPCKSQLGTTMTLEYCKATRRSFEAEWRKRYFPLIVCAMLSAMAFDHISRFNITGWFIQ